MGREFTQLNKAERDGIVIGRVKELELHLFGLHLNLTELTATPDFKNGVPEVIDQVAGIDAQLTDVEMRIGAVLSLLGDGNDGLSTGS